MEMSDEMIQKAKESFGKLQEYFDEFAKEHGIKGFVWISNDKTGELIVYTRGEYRNEFLNFIEKL